MKPCTLSKKTNKFSKGGKCPPPPPKRNPARVYINVHVHVYTSVFIICSYGAPLAQRASYLALHSSLFGQVAQLIMVILSVTALTLAQDVFPMVDPLTVIKPI